MTTESDFPSTKLYDLNATIAVGNTTSNAVDLSGTELVGLFVPANLTGTAISLQAAATPGGTYYTVQDGYGADVSITVAASRFVAVPNLSVTSGLRYIQLVSGTTQASTNAVITLATRPL